MINLVVFVFLLTYLHSYENGVNSLENLDAPPIFITVSSLYEETQGPHYIDRLIQLNWNPEVKSIGFFTKDPTEGVEPVIRFYSVEGLDGFYETNISLNNPDFPSGWDIKANKEAVPGEHCLPFWIASYTNNKIDRLECLKLRPTWMYDNRLSLGHLPLTSLFIPGTHNSGCFKRGKSLSKKDISNRYILTQDQDVWNQLVFGIRYLDIRVGYYPLRKNGLEQPCGEHCFWINHDLIKVRPLFPLLREVKEFTKRAKGEIIILDLHRFPVGFTGRSGRHELMADLLEKELGHLAIPHLGNISTLTLDDIWKTDKRLIISYGDNSTVLERLWLWPSIKQLWGNKQTPKELKEYLSLCMQADFRSTLWAAMAQLTPAPLDMLLNPRRSLRHMASDVNGNLTRWIREKWWDRANIVASDFFLGNDIISLAVNSNLKKAYSHKIYSFD